MSILYTQESLFVNIAGDNVVDLLVRGAASHNVNVTAEDIGQGLVLRIDMAHGECLAVNILYYHNVRLLRLAHRVVPLNNVQKFDILHNSILFNLFDNANIDVFS